MGWRVAGCIIQLLREVNEAHPYRKKMSDGTIGDAKHATRSSDHNPWVKDRNGVGVVTAVDIDDNGGSLDYLAELFRSLGKAGDKRIKYVICNGRIASEKADWAWRKYNGPNGHFKHCHLSVSTDPRFYDSRAGWGVQEKNRPIARTLPAPDRKDDDMNRIPVVRQGDRGQFAKNVQGLLVAAGRNVKIDGDFGPASVAALKEWQGAVGITADGIAGPTTYRHLLGAH